MTGKGLRIARFFTLLFVLVFAAQACIMTASADDPETLKRLPGQWTCSGEYEQEQEMQTADMSFSFEENGALSLLCSVNGGEHEYSYEGTWSFEFVPDDLDRLTLLFTSTDNPSYAGSEYNLECVYTAYTESWMENDTFVRTLILEPVSCSGVPLFEEFFGYDGAALESRQGPNMRVVKCKDYVSLREKAAKSSARLAKVPLGALVYADPEVSEKNGFVYCTYHDQEGFILAEYLEPAD